jgi:hypothetical protein
MKPIKLTAMLRSMTVAAFITALTAGTFGYGASVLAEPAAKQQPEKRESSEKREHAHKHKHGIRLITDAANVIGMKPEELQKQVQEGKSIVEVAKSKGIDEADLTDRMLAIRMKSIDEAVKSGKWDAERAERIKEKMPEHLKRLLNRKGMKFSKSDS